MIDLMTLLIAGACMAFAVHQARSSHGGPFQNELGPKELQELHESGGSRTAVVAGDGLTTNKKAQQ